MISVNLTGRLTRDPELRQVADPGRSSELEVCHLRVACKDRRGNPVYLDVAEWGPAGRAAAERLGKGSLIAFTGELRFRETQGENGRQYVSAVGHIELLGRREAAPADAASADEPAGEPIPF